MISYCSGKFGLQACKYADFLDPVRRLAFWEVALFSSRGEKSSSMRIFFLNDFVLQWKFWSASLQVCGLSRPRQEAYTVKRECSRAAQLAMRLSGRCLAWGASWLPSCDLGSPWLTSCLVRGALWLILTSHDPGFMYSCRCPMFLATGPPWMCWIFPLTYLTDPKERCFCGSFGQREFQEYLSNADWAQQAVSFFS